MDTVFIIKKQKKNENINSCLIIISRLMGITTFFGDRVSSVTVGPCLETILEGFHSLEQPLRGTSLLVD
jgi:hypothetical protein